MTLDGKELMKVPALARQWGVTTAYIYKLLRDGKLKGERSPTGEWLVEPDQIEAFDARTPTRSRKMRFPGRVTRKLTVAPAAERPPRLLRRIIPDPERRVRELEGLLRAIGDVVQAGLVV
jgi:hypothetical protein